MDSLTSDERERIRRAYVESAEPVKSIAERHGVTSRALYELRRRERWPLRSQQRTVPSQGPARGRRPAANGVADAAAARKAKLIQRLYRAIESKLSQLETSMSSADHPSAADSERETRAIGALIANIEKVAELENDLTRAATGQHNAGDGLYGGDEADRRRRALAERLARVQQRQSRSFADSGGTDGGAG